MKDIKEIVTEDFITILNAEVLEQIEIMDENNMLGSTLHSQTASDCISAVLKRFILGSIDLENPKLTSDLKYLYEKITGFQL